MIIDLFMICIGAVFVQNIVFVHFLGAGSLVGVSLGIRESARMGLAVMLMMMIASALTYLADRYILVLFEMEYLQTLMFVMIIIAVVHVSEDIFKLNTKMLTISCAVLGCAVLNIESFEKTSGGSLIESVVFGVMSGFGFLIAAVLFAGIKERLDMTDAPKAMDGIPIMLVSAALVAMAFMGFAGMVR